MLFTLVLEPKEEGSEEVTDSGSGEEVSNESIVSLHTLHGVRTPSINRTMKLIRFYKRRRVCILVDSGSTHNLDITLAK